MGEGPKHRLHQKKRALQKLISCLEVNKTDLTKKCTAKQTCLRGPQHRPHTDESTHSKGKQNSCLGVKKDLLHTGEHRQTYLPQGHKTTTTPKGEHPQQGQAKFVPRGQERSTSHRRAPTRKANESSDTKGRKAKFTQNLQTKPHTLFKKKNQKN